MGSDLSLHSQPVEGADLGMLVAAQDAVVRVSEENGAARQVGIYESEKLIIGISRAPWDNQLRMMA